MFTLQIDKKLLMMKVHFFLAMATPITPFLSTILMQRGYSPVIIGLILTLLPLPALFIRPVVGAITDKYKCRKTVLISTIIINSLVVCALMFIPGKNVETEIADVNVIKSPLFWLFFTTVTILSTCMTTRSILENTICIGLLGENKYKYGQQRVWGAVGWGILSLVSGVVIDWSSKGQVYKNYTPSKIIVLMVNILDIYVVSKIEINKKLLPMKMHFFLALAGTASIIPFLSTISKQRGYSPLIVGIIFTVVPLPGLLLRPITGAITDKYKCRKSAIILTIVIKIIFINVLMFIPGSTVKTITDDKSVVKSPLFWLFFCTIVVFKTSSDIRNILEVTICVDLLDEDKTKYGHQRMWGAIGWGTMSIISGMCVDWCSKGLEYKIYTSSFIISLICQLLDIYVISRITNVQTEEIEARPSDIKKVLTQIRVLSFFLWVVIHGMLLSFVWYFVFLYLEDLSNLYHPEMKPYIRTIQGLSLTIQCFGGEVPFFFLSNFIIKLVGYMNVFSLMFLVFAIRFYLYSIITNPVWVLPVELFNGITFALAHSAAISYSGILAPDGAKGTLQGIVGVLLTGIGSPIGCLFGGYLFNQFGSITSFKFLSIFALVVCFTQTIVHQLINRFSKNNLVKEEVFDIS
ncbi:hypothetical protein QTP88_026595 [Uroleucon formosanum]